MPAIMTWLTRVFPSILNALGLASLINWFNGGSKPSTTDIIWDVIKLLTIIVGLFAIYRYVSGGKLMRIFK